MSNPWNKPSDDASKQGSGDPPGNSFRPDAPTFRPVNSQPRVKASEIFSYLRPDDSGTNRSGSPYFPLESEPFMPPITPTFNSGFDPAFEPQQNSASNRMPDNNNQHSINVLGHGHSAPLSTTKMSSSGSAQTHSGNSDLINAHNALKAASEASRQQSSSSSSGFVQFTSGVSASPGSLPTPIGQGRKKSKSKMARTAWSDPNLMKNLFAEDLPSSSIPFTAAMVTNDARSTGTVPGHAPTTNPASVPSRQTWGGFPTPPRWEQPNQSSSSNQSALSGPFNNAEHSGLGLVDFQSSSSVLMGRHGFAAKSRANTDFPTPSGNSFASPPHPNNNQSSTQSSAQPSAQPSQPPPSGNTFGGQQHHPIDRFSAQPSQPPPPGNASRGPQQYRTNQSSAQHFQSPPNGNAFGGSQHHPMNQSSAQHFQSPPNGNAFGGSQHHPMSQSSAQHFQSPPSGNAFGDTQYQYTNQFPAQFPQPPSYSAFAGPQHYQANQPSAQHFQQTPSGAFGPPLYQYNDQYSAQSFQRPPSGNTFGLQPYQHTDHFSAQPFQQSHSGDAFGPSTYQHANQSTPHPLSTNFTSPSQGSGFMNQTSTPSTGTSIHTGHPNASMWAAAIRSGLAEQAVTPIPSQQLHHGMYGPRGAFQNPGLIRRGPKYPKMPAYAKAEDPFVEQCTVVGRPSVKDAFIQAPFAETSRRVQSSTYGVIKIFDIPYHTTKNEVIAFLGNKCPLVQQPEHAPWFSVHIIMDRQSGKSLECFVELQSEQAAASAAKKYQGLSKSKNRPRMGDRAVHVTLSSQEELMERVFPRAKCVTWTGGNPTIYKTTEAFNSGFQYFVDSEELVGLEKMAENPNRSRFASSHPQRVYESMISLLAKFPWSAAGHITVGLRNHIYYTLRVLMHQLTQQLLDNKTGPPLTSQLLHELIVAGLETPGFSEEQHFEIYEAGTGYDFKLDWVSPIGKSWPFHILRRKDSVAEDRILYFAFLMGLSAESCFLKFEDLREEYLRAPNQNGRNPFGNLLVYAANAAGDERKTMEEAGGLEWSMVEHLLVTTLAPVAH